MNETQYRVGDLVKYAPDGDKGIVVKVHRSMEVVWIYWFRDAELDRHGSYRSNIQILSRGHRNE